MILRKSSHNCFKSYWIDIRALNRLTWQKWLKKHNILINYSTIHQLIPKYIKHINIYSNIIQQTAVLLIQNTPCFILLKETQTFIFRCILLLIFAYFKFLNIELFTAFHSFYLSALSIFFHTENTLIDLMMTLSNKSDLGQIISYFKLLFFLSSPSHRENSLSVLFISQLVLALPHTLLNLSCIIKGGKPRSQSAVPQRWSQMIWTLAVLKHGNQMCAKLQD